MADPRNCPAHGHKQQLFGDAEPEIIDLPTFFRQVSLFMQQPSRCHDKWNLALLKFIQSLYFDDLREPVQISGSSDDSWEVEERRRVSYVPHEYCINCE